LKKGEHAFRGVRVKPLTDKKTKDEFSPSLKNREPSRSPKISKKEESEKKKKYTAWGDGTSEAENVRSWVGRAERRRKVYGGGT